MCKIRKRQLSQQAPFQKKNKNWNSRLCTQFWWLRRPYFSNDRYVSLIFLETLVIICTVLFFSATCSSPFGQLLSCYRKKKNRTPHLNVYIYVRQDVLIWFWIDHDESSKDHATKVVVRHSCIYTTQWMGMTLVGQLIGMGSSRGSRHRAFDEPRYV
jgi:ABC-type uncharacterized transport system fused permease/ATPase subunit